MPERVPSQEQSATPEAPLGQRMVVDALASGDYKRARAAIARVDAFLTGVTSRFQMDEQGIRSELTAFLERVNQKRPGTNMVYLGDHGLSRLVMTYNGKDVSVELAFVSPPEVKEKWATLAKSGD